MSPGQDKGVTRAGVSTGQGSHQGRARGSVVLFNFLHMQNCLGKLLVDVFLGALIPASSPLLSIPGDVTHKSGMDRRGEPAGISGVQLRLVGVQVFCT